MDRTSIFFVILICFIGGGYGAPTITDEDLDKIIEDFLGGLYDRYYGSSGNGDIYEQMQGDQPNNNNNNKINGDFAKFINLSTIYDHNIKRNMSDGDYFRTMRNRQRENDQDDRTKDNWIQALKVNILQQIGRSNMTTTRVEDARTNSLNISSIIPNFFNGTYAEDDHIAEKIRSYYPSCDVPSNVDQDIWKDENVMNLYFNFDHNNDASNIATATLRLYRIPSDNSTKLNGKTADCDNNNSMDDDRLLRVSIYWYTRSTRKKKAKRRLSDSKVIQENSRWVELSVKPATRAWSRGRNLGLAVLVEDQEGNVLRPDRLFKGATCMVGASTPKPIPTIITDALRRSNELNRIHSLLGRNTTSSIPGDIPMLPSIDICTLEFPENYSHPPPHISNLRINACNLKKSHEHSQKSVERDRLERLATLPEFIAPSSRHIRHQRQHLKNNEFDPRSKIVNKRILTNEELQALNLNITTVDR